MSDFNALSGSACCFGRRLPGACRAKFGVLRDKLHKIAKMLTTRSMSAIACLRQLRLCRTEASHPVKLLRGILFWEAKQGL